MKLLSNIGVNYDEMGNYALALDYYFKSLKKAEEANDSSSIAYAELNIGTVHFQLNDVNKAYQSNQKALNQFKLLKDLDGQSISLGNLAEYAFDLGNYDSAEYYSKETLAVAQSIDDAIGISIAYTLLGKLKIHYDSIDVGIGYYNKALEVSKLIDDVQGISQIMSLISTAYYKKGNHKRATEYGLEALKIAESIEALDDMKTAHHTLYSSYKKMGKSDKSLYHYEKYTAIKDSLFSESNTAKMTNLASSYELDKKLNQISLLEKDKKLASAEAEKQNVLLNSLIIGGSLLILAVFLLFRNNYNKTKANKILADKNLEIERKNNRINSSLKYAERIQTAILPFHNKLSSFFSDHFILYKPKDVVSGDFYYFQKIGSKAVLIVADCTGHGIPGAFMSMIGSSLLNQIILEQGEISPDRILEQMHQGVVTVLHQGGHDLKDGMEMAVCVIDKGNSSISFAGAKRPFIMVSDGELQEIKGQKRAIGEQSRRTSKQFENHHINIKPDSKIYLLTDGLQDQFGGSENKKFMMKRIRALLLENHGLPMATQSETFHNTLADWVQTGKEEQVDDILLFGAKI